MDQQLGLFHCIRLTIWRYGIFLFCCLRSCMLDGINYQHQRDDTNWGFSNYSDSDGRQRDSNYEFYLQRDLSINLSNTDAPPCSDRVWQKLLCCHKR